MFQGTHVRIRNINIILGAVRSDEWLHSVFFGYKHKRLRILLFTIFLGIVCSMHEYIVVGKKR